jgi:hypothetical protein
VGSDETSDIYRLALLTELVSSGFSHHAATLVALAAFPLDDDVPAGEEFEARVQGLAKTFAASIRTSATSETAVNTITNYADLARRAGHDYYIARYETALTEFAMQSTTHRPTDAYVRPNVRPVS